MSGEVSWAVTGPEGLAFECGSEAPDLVNALEEIKAKSNAFLSATQCVATNTRTRGRFSARAEKRPRERYRERDRGREGERERGRERARESARSRNPNRKNARHESGKSVSRGRAPLLSATREECDALPRLVRYSLGKTFASSVGEAIESTKGVEGALTAGEAQQTKRKKK